ncbi:hypothetical protein [Kutzneria buriramensis]|uniref:Uncharacterized protein n=1 Tax=Kutzneria buriramensis TaxID=1045776 RepID=A0A3E0I9U7_9PSEU|nr:hypothetical protein [Kutzneria buriramensis]REH55381.1 hypothetical protein BCF44_101401 [Kutzneria buriramensis]
MFFSNKWRTVTVGLLAAGAVVLANEGSAFAAGAPGEEKGWHGEYYQDSSPNHNNRQITTQGVMAEARTTNGNLLHIWRSADGQGVLWGSWNGGEAFQLGGVRSNYSPTVVQFGGGVALFYTHPTDHHIYWAWLNPRARGTNWTQLPFRSEYGPSVTQIPSQSGTQLYLAYREDDSLGTAILGNFYDGQRWGDTQYIDAETHSAPTVTYNAANRRIWVAHVDPTAAVQLNFQTLGSSNWSSTIRVGGSVYGPVGFASTGTNMQIAARSTADNAIWYTEIGPDGRGLNGGNWTRDQSGQTTPWGVNLSVVNGIIYAITTATTLLSLYKQTYNGK